MQNSLVLFTTKVTNSKFLLKAVKRSEKCSCVVFRLGRPLTAPLNGIDGVFGFLPGNLVLTSKPLFIQIIREHVGNPSPYQYQYTGLSIGTCIVYIEYIRSIRSIQNVHSKHIHTISIPWNTMPCHVMPCHSMPYHTITLYYILFHCILAARTCISAYLCTNSHIQTRTYTHTYLPACHPTYIHRYLHT